MQYIAVFGVLALWAYCDVKATSAGVQKLGMSSTEFGLELYNELLKDTSMKNMFISPVSVSLALSMVLLGAKDNTADEMIKTLHFSNYRDNVHSYSQGFLDIINAADKPYELSSANRLYGRTGYEFVQQFLTDTAEYYRASLERLDFAEAEAARQTINTWVEEQTNNKIKDLIPPGIIDASVVMVLVNAIYFKGNWVYQFNEEKTIDSQFTTLSGNSLQTKMMQFTVEDLEETEFNYTHSDDLKAKVLELPYKGWDVNMYIFLPDEEAGLPQVESQLTAEKVNDIIENQLSATNLERIRVPKFKMEFHAELVPFLEAMGMKDVMTGAADLSGIGGSQGDLYISNVIHKSFVDVNEEGTEAAAATAVIIRESAALNPIYFDADHPFLFIIRERSTKSTLFMGRLVETSSDGTAKSGFKSGEGTYTPDEDTNNSATLMLWPLVFLFSLIFGLLIV